MAPVKRLPELIKDRLAELGDHGQPLSIRAAARRSAGKISHAQLASIVNGNYGKISDRILQGLAVAVDLPYSTVYESYGVPRPYEPFQLPKDADRLTRRQREAVLSVVRAMLDPATSEAPQPLRAVARQGQRGDAATVEKKAAAARRRQAGRD